MTQEGGPRGHSDGGPRVRRPERPASAPPRPELGGEGFAATIEMGAPPTSVLASMWLWVASALAGVAASAALWVAQDPLRARLAVAVVEQDPDRPADVVVDAARYAFLAATGSVLLVAVLHLGLALAMRAGRLWARNLLVVTGVLGIAVSVLVQDVVADPARSVLTDLPRVALFAQAALALAALVVLLLPAPRRWFRRARALV
jgi:hypothetical protein